MSSEIDGLSLNTEKIELSSSNISPLKSISKETISIFNKPELKIDLKYQEECDPSLLDGYEVIYDREIPFEIRLQDSSSFSNEKKLITKHTFIENLHVKILVQGPSTNPIAYKIELSSENNLFFYYVTVCTSHEFPSLQYEQKLMVEFTEYSTVLIRLFNLCLNEPLTHIAMLLLKKDNIAESMEETMGTLIFIKNMEYKLMDLLTLKFSKMQPSLLHHQIVYRYSLMKRKTIQMQEQLNDILQVIKLKNPSLLLQIQRNPSSKNNITASTVYSSSAPQSTKSLRRKGSFGSN